MNRKTKWSHRLLALALAAVMCCSVFPVGAFAETPLPQESTVATEEQQTDETETDNGQTDASNIVGDHAVLVSESGIKTNADMKKVRSLGDRKSTRLNSSHRCTSRMPSSA